MLFLCLDFIMPSTASAACWQAGSNRQCDTQNEAFSECYARQGEVRSLGPYPYEWAACTAYPSARQFVVILQNGAAAPAPYIFSYLLNCEDQNLAESGNGFTCADPQPDCTQGADAGSSFYSSLEPGSSCKNGCLVQTTTGSCTQDSTGSVQCLLNEEQTGESCDQPPISDAPPDNCTADADSGLTTCDCTFDSGPWCTGATDNPPVNCIVSGGIVICPTNNDTPDSPGNSDSGGETGNDTDNQPPTDGNPDTPDAPGTGDGDTDGDGGRDVDCDPHSNPDCKWTSSASWSSICGAAPVCSGDPVQCAQLMQEYNSMCATITGSNQITSVLNQIKSELTRSQAWTEPNDLENAKDDKDEKEGKIKDPDSEYWAISENESGQFMREHTDGMAALFHSFFDPLAGSSCPVMVVAFMGNTVTIDLNPYAPVIRLFMNLAMWYYVATQGIFLFFRIAL